MIRFLHFLVISRVLYACSTLTQTSELEIRTQSLGVKCYGMILNVSDRDYIYDGEVGNRICSTAGSLNELFHYSKWWMLKWYGHFSRSPRQCIKELFMKQERRVSKRRDAMIIVKSWQVCLMQHPKSSIRQNKLVRLDCDDVIEDALITVILCNKVSKVDFYKNQAYKISNITRQIMKKLQILKGKTDTNYLIQLKMRLS